MSTLTEAAELLPTGPTIDEVMEQIDALAAKALRVKAERDELLALVKQYASECSNCDGRGLVTVKTWPGGVEVDNDDQPCPDCADIRAVIEKAVGT